MWMRILWGLIAVALLIGVMFAGVKIFVFAIFGLALLAINEMFNSFSKEGMKPLKVIGFLACLSIPLYSLQTEFGYTVPLGAAFLTIFGFLAILFCWFVFKFENTSTADISTTVLGTFYIVFAFLSLALIRALNHGDTLVWIAFIGAWATDTFAYIAGITYGKKKILPLVSPQKSLEGSIGGVLGCIIVMILFGIIIQDSSLPINRYFVVLLGLLCGLFSQLGDWAMSAFKRKSKIKDFGKFLPGHGGVLDRFDSILFISPLIYGFLLLLLK